MIRIGDHRQFWSGAFFAAVGVLALLDLPKHVGTIAAMGPGYFPMLLGVCLVSCGGVSMLQALMAQERAKVERLPLVPLSFVVGGALAFAGLIEKAGLAVALACLVAAACYERLVRRPLEVLAIYVILLAMTWVIFIYAIQLPIELY